MNTASRFSTILIFAGALGGFGAKRGSPTDVRHSPGTLQALRPGARQLAGLVVWPLGRQWLCAIKLPVFLADWHIPASFASTIWGRGLHEWWQLLGRAGLSRTAICSPVQPGELSDTLPGANMCATAIPGSDFGGLRGL